MIDSVWLVNVSNLALQLALVKTAINLDRSRGGGLRMIWLLLMLLVAKAVTPLTAPLNPMIGHSHGLSDTHVWRWNIISTGA